MEKAFMTNTLQEDVIIWIKWIKTFTSAASFKQYWDY